MGFHWNSSKPLKQVYAQTQVAKAKIVQNTLILKFWMMLSAVIFDLNLKSPIFPKSNCLVSSPENATRFGLHLQNLEQILAAAWLKFADAYI